MPVAQETIFLMLTICLAID